MTRVVYAGREKLRIPAGWTEFVWHGRRYRLAGSVVEVLSHGVWAESLILTTAAPKGRRAAMTVLTLALVALLGLVTPAAADPIIESGSTDPATLLLVGAGLLLGTGWRRRRRP